MKNLTLLVLLFSSLSFSQFTINNVDISNGCYDMSYYSVEYSDAGNNPPYTIQVWHMNISPYPPYLIAETTSNNNVDVVNMSVNLVGVSDSLHIYVINNNSDTVAAYAENIHSFLNAFKTYQNCSPGPADLIIGAGGGTPPYLYSVNNGPWTTTNFFPGFGSCGTYPSVAVMDADGCIEYAMSLVANGGGNGNNPPCAKEITVIKTDETSYGSCDGTVSWTVTGLDTNFTHEIHFYSMSSSNGYDTSFTISGSDTTGILTNVCPNSYYIKIDEDSTCTDFFSFSILGVPLIQSTASINLNTVNGCWNCQGWIDFTVIDYIDKAPLTITLHEDGSLVAIDSMVILGSGINHTFENVCPGNYSVRVIDINSDTALVTTSIDSLFLGAYVMHVVHPAIGFSNGQIKLTSCGGVPPYVYSLDGSTWTSNQLFSNLSAGFYTGYVKDSAGDIESVDIELIGEDQTGFNEEKIDFNIYPNPTSSYVTVIFPGKFDVTISDFSGKTILKETCSDATLLDLSGFTPGCYIINLLSDDAIISSRIIKE